MGIKGIYSQGYGYIVFDYGCIYENLNNEILMSDNVFVLGSTVEWKYSEYERFCIKNSEAVNSAGGRYFAFNTDKERAKLLKKKYGIKLNKVPVITNPYKLDKAAIDFLKKEYVT